MRRYLSKCHGAWREWRRIGKYGDLVLCCIVCGRPAETYE
jgi:hypothetical protein